MLAMQTQLDRHDCVNYVTIIILTMQACDELTLYAYNSNTKFGVHLIRFDQGIRRLMG